MVEEILVGVWVIGLDHLQENLVLDLLLLEKDSLFFLRFDN